MNRRGALVLLLAIAAALGLRFPGLDARPLHNDEAVNAFKVTELWQEGRYVYDPDEYHGPTLHYATLPFLWLSGARSAEALKDSTLRLAPVVFGVGLILLLPLWGDGLGRSALGWAAVFMAVSPAMVFYSRYFIHEMLLVFFTALTLGAGWRYVRTRSAGWALAAGAGLGLMSATKETFVLTLAAMAAAGVYTLWSMRGQRPVRETMRDFWNPRHAGLACGAACAVWLLFFTSFFTNASGPLDSVRTYLPWIQRAGGDSPHIHPWSFYLQRLAWFHPAKGPAWSEGLILGLAAVGAAVSLGGRKSALHRFLAVYTLVLMGIYSVISYKTPWCLLGFFHGMILLAGVGAVELTGMMRGRAVKVGMVAVMGALTVQLAWQAWRAGHGFAADRRNPYVYAQTSADLLQLMQRMDGIARVAPEGYKTLVKVVAPESDYWPMPWYLRQFGQLGWYDRLPEDPWAPVLVVSSALDARLDDRSERKWIMAGLTELRPGVFFELYVELELWKKFVETLPRDRD